MQFKSCHTKNLCNHLHGHLWSMITTMIVLATKRNCWRWCRSPLWKQLPLLCWTKINGDNLSSGAWRSVLSMGRPKRQRAAPRVILVTVVRSRKTKTNSETSNTSTSSKHIARPLARYTSSKHVAKTDANICLFNTFRQLQLPFFSPRQVHQHTVTVVVAIFYCFRITLVIVLVAMVPWYLFVHPAEGNLSHDPLTVCRRLPSDIFCTCIARLNRSTYPPRWCVWEVRAERRVDVGCGWWWWSGECGE